MEELTKNCTEISNNFRNKRQRNPEKTLKIFGALLKIYPGALHSLTLLHCFSNFEKFFRTKFCILCLFWHRKFSSAPNFCTNFPFHKIFSNTKFYTIFSAPNFLYFFTDSKIFSNTLFFVTFLTWKFCAAANLLYLLIFLFKKLSPNTKLFI